MFQNLRVLVSDLLLLLIMLVIDLPIAFFVSKNNSQDRSICFVRLDNIGDFILWLDAAKGLREFYSDRHLTLVVDKALVEIAKDTGLWNEVWPIDRQRMKLNLLYRYKLLYQARKCGFHTVIHPTFSREFILGDAFVLATGAINRIGSVGDLNNIRVWQKMISNHWYTQLIPAKKDSLMELVRNAEFLRGLGYASFRAKCPRLLNKQHLPTAPYYILFPGSSRTLKKWPASSFAQLADWLFEYSGFEGVICGTAEEQAAAKKIQHYSKSVLNDLTGHTSLDKLANIIAGAELLIGNDTGAVHIAAAVGTPVVCILGGGHYGRFLPYQTEQPCNTPRPIPVIHTMNCFGCNWRCHYDFAPDEPAPCIARITVKSVVETVGSVIDARQPSKKD